jgi:hypothetical protein
MFITGSIGNFIGRNKEYLLVLEELHKQHCVNIIEQFIGVGFYGRKTMRLSERQNLFNQGNQLLLLMLANITY